MSAHHNSNRLLLHNARVASEVRDANSLQERTERSLSLADTFCHGKGSHSSEVSWSFVEFVLGGEGARKHQSSLSTEHIGVIERVGTIRDQMRKNLGAIVSKVELKVPFHHTYPVPRAVWVGRLGRPAPSYELRRRGEGQFAVTLNGLIRDRYVGTGPIEHRYFGDSSHVIPLDPETKKFPIAAFGFVLSANGIEKSDENYPTLIYGRDTLLSVVDHESLGSAGELNLRACLEQIESAR